jgi:hypothetical protein
MSVEVGKFHHEDGTFDHAIASPEDDGNGLKVTVFPEPGAQYDVHHHVPRGTEGGKFSAQ